MLSVIARLLRLAVPVLFVVAACANEAPAPAVPTGSSDTAGPQVDAATSAPTLTTAGSAATPSNSGIAPLTGVVAVDTLARPALVVKIDNHDRARPQLGLGSADVVYEEIVEGGLTRFAAVFHSRDADLVGPVRSVRTSDFPLLESLGTPLFANSGGNDGVLALLADVDAIDVSSNAAGGAYYRFDERGAPHNLVTDTVSLWAAGETRGAAGSPPRLFAYLADDERVALGAVQTSGVAINYGSTSVTYEWSDRLQGWARTQNGVPHVDAAGSILAPTNVIVQFVSYGRSAADGRSPEAEWIGTGEAWIFTEATITVGTWERAGVADVTTYLDDDGVPIALRPGTTWVALPRVGQVTLLD